MSAEKIGRPTDSPKNTMIRVRVDDYTLEKLDECVSKMNSNRSEIILKGISMVFNTIIK